MTTSLPKPNGPLVGLRVIDTGRIVAGPWAAAMLADFGAEVIRVEGKPFEPPFADPLRLGYPILPPDASPEEGVGSSFVQYNRNKLSLGLDVTQPAGREVFLELVRKSDIWINNSRPGTFDKFKLSNDIVLEANRKLTIVHISGFGQYGHPDYIHRPSYDLVAQAFSGFLGCQGDPEPQPPMRPGTAINDPITGLAGAVGALMSYIHAQRTGEGQIVDVAQYEVMFLMMENMAIDYFTRGVVRRRYGNAHPRVHPYEVYPAKDGFIALAAPTPLSWTKLCRLLGLPPDPNQDDMEWRVTHREEINLSIRRFTEAHTVAELEAIGLKHDIAFAPILSMDEIAKNPHYAAREMFVRWHDNTIGEVTGAGIAPKFSKTAGAVWRGAPWLGQDNAFVLGDILGYSAARQSELAFEGVVGEYKPRRSTNTRRSKGDTR